MSSINQTYKLYLYSRLKVDKGYKLEVSKQ